MSEFSKALGNMMSGQIDLGKVVEIVNAIVAAAPAIEKGVASAEPYIAAIVGLVSSGGAPSAEDWAALRSRLDMGSAALAAAAEIPDPEPAAQASPETPAVQPDPSPSDEEAGK